MRKLFSLNRAYSLIEVIVVIALIGILSAIAIPTYNNYTMKTKINTMLINAKDAKFMVEKDYLKFSTLANSNYASESTEITTTTAEHIKSIDIIKGEITLIGTPGHFAGKNITLTFKPVITNGELQWNCYPSEEAKNFITHTDCQP